MRTFGVSRFACRCAAAAAVLVGWPVFAQIGISLKTDMRHYLRYEPVMVTVILRNYSGNTLIFGNEGSNRGKLHFSIERQEGGPVPCTDRSFNPAADLVLGAGESRELSLALNTVYDLQREGIYMVTAQIGHQRLPNDYRSETVSVSIRDGLPLITRDIGLPASTPGEVIRGVRVSLLLFQDGERGVYCLRAEDDAAVYGTVRLGPQITGSQPQMDADAASDVHVLIQLQPRLFVHAVYGISATGVRLRQRQYYGPDEYGPRMTRAPGYLKIIGGIPVREAQEEGVGSPGSRPRLGSQ